MYDTILEHNNNNNNNNNDNNNNNNNDDDNEFVSAYPFYKEIGSSSENFIYKKEILYNKIPCLK